MGTNIRALHSNEVVTKRCHCMLTHLNRKKSAELGGCTIRGQILAEDTVSVTQGIAAHQPPALLKQSLPPTTLVPDLAGDYSLQWAQNFHLSL